MQKKNNNNKQSYKNKKQTKETRAPVASSRNRTNLVPNISQTVLQNLVITHREFIRDLSGTAAFTADGLDINPGNPTLFPWLSTIAPNFESYKIRRMKFSYETMAPTSKPGSVILAIDYDPEDDLPANKAYMMSYEGASRCAPWSRCFTTFDCSRLQNRNYFVRGYVNPGAQKLYDAGSFIYATDGNDNTNAIGELWVDYEIELIHPQVSELIAPALCQTCTGNQVGHPYVGVMFKTGQLPVTNGTASTTLRFQFEKVGDYLWIQSIVGTLIDNPYSHMTFSNPAPLYQGLDNSYTAGGSHWRSQVILSIDKIGQYVDINMAACFGTVSSWSAIIVPCDYETVLNLNPNPH